MKDQTIGMKVNKMTWYSVVALLVLTLQIPFDAKCAETNFSGIVKYVFEPNPHEIKPKMYNWEIRLNGTDSRNGPYEIIQITTRLGIHEENHGSTNVLVGISRLSQQPTILANGDGVIDFNLYVGEKEPAQNMNGPGNIGQPIIFSGIGTGNGASDWIVLPGSKVNKVTPSDKGTKLSDGRLRIIQFLVTNDSGEKYQTDVLLQRK